MEEKRGFRCIIKTFITWYRRIFFSLPQTACLAWASNCKFFFCIFICN